MKLFIRAFYPGFKDKTNPVHVQFFLDLFEKVFEESIFISEIIEECDILLESIFSKETFLHLKEWKYSFLFYGESYVNMINHCGNERLKDFDKYSCLLCGERNHKNVVNVSLYIPYIYCNNWVNELKEKHKFLSDIQIQMPYKPPACAIISNSNGKVRNKFLDTLEQYIHIDYAGGYKTNIQPIHGQYNSPELLNFMAQYKFTITMENSSEDTYITEKIINGFMANTIPIYWGSKRVYDYFNKERFLCLDNDDDESINALIIKVLEIINDDNKYKEILQKPIFVENVRDINDVAYDIRQIIFSKKWSLVTNVFIISSFEFEPNRYNEIKNEFKEHNVQFICPTYKHTITDEIYNYHVKDHSKLACWNRTLYKSELSVILNHISILKHIEKNYKDGIFLIFESDVIKIDSNNQFNSFLEMIETKKNENVYNWDIISLGTYAIETINNMDNEWYHIDENCNDDKFNLIQKQRTNSADSLLWSYSGIKKFLNILEKENDYNLPFDNFIDRILNKYPEIKLYWSMTSFFLQKSNFIDRSTSTIR